MLRPQQGIDSFMSQRSSIGSKAAGLRGPDQKRQTHAGLDSENLNFSAPFINRPVATCLLSIAVILAGVAGYSALPVSSLPQVEFAVINVSVLAVVHVGAVVHLRAVLHVPVLCVHVMA